MKYTPYEYQEESIVKIIAALKEKGQALVHMATALGKTFTVAFSVERMKPKRILFLVHNVHILEHAREEFTKILGNTVPMANYHGHDKEGAHDVETKIVFATWQTMKGKLKEWDKDHFDLMIVDEAHHSHATEWKKVIPYFEANRIGMTATPDREDRQNVRDFFGQEVVDIGLPEAWARGLLPKVNFYCMMDIGLDEAKLDGVLKEIGSSSKRLTVKDLNKRLFIKKRDEDIAAIINELPEKCLVFCSSIAHANDFVKHLKDAAVFHSKSGKNSARTAEKNKQVLEDFESGKLKRVCAVNAFNEGVNVPSIGMVAFLSKTGSRNVALQRLGRGLRPGHGELLAHDYAGGIEEALRMRKLADDTADAYERITTPEQRKKDGYVRTAYKVSGAGFSFEFEQRFVDIVGLLEGKIRRRGSNFYPTVAEMVLASHRLGIYSIKDYKLNHNKDPKLPGSPPDFYDDFSWRMLSGNDISVKYPTWQQASKSAKKLRLKNAIQYSLGYKKDPKLPSCLDQFYSDFPGYTVFFGREKKSFYPTWQEASKSVIRLGITKQSEYNARRKEDKRLPANPQTVYKDYPGFGVFCGVSNGIKPYKTLREAGRAANRLGIRTMKQYERERKRDPRLPSEPRRAYKDYVSFPAFLGRIKKSFYPTLREASRAVRVLGIKSLAEYSTRYKEDPMLPSVLARRYSDWISWSAFLAKADDAQGLAVAESGLGAAFYA